MDNTMEQKSAGNAAYYWVGGIIIVLLGLGIWFFNRTPATEPVATDTETPLPTTTIHPYGSVTLKLGESASFNGITITPLKVEEDSRCAQGVQCVWAGTVKVSVKTEIDNGPITTNMVTLGQKTTVDTFAVGLTNVLPPKMKDAAIAGSDYSLTFDVHQSSVIDNELIGK